MAEESQPGTSDSTEQEIQPSTSNQISVADQKTPYSEKYDPPRVESRKRNRFSDTGDIWKPPKPRPSPLPFLPWANNTEVWQTMIYTEEVTSRTRSSKLFENPESCLPRMRAILVDWIMEVCEVYRLRRVTYYLAIDYIDRFLTIKPNVPKHQLQMVGISALFIAAKLEEIYPPRLSEFTYVCDGACNNSEILECELLLLTTLSWDVNPMTPTSWLNLYFQIHFEIYKSKRKDSKMNAHFFYCQYSAYDFVCASHLIDLFSLDPAFLLFNYSVIAAAAIYFLYGRSVAVRVSGLCWTEIRDCVDYMAVFYTTIRDAEDPKLRTVITQCTDERLQASYRYIKSIVSTVTTNEGHFLQTHVVNLKYFENSILIRVRRMGFTIRKRYFKFKSSSTSDVDEEEDDMASTDEDLDNVMIEIDENEVDSDDPPFIMFEIDNKGTDNCVSSTAELFDNSSRYTFDELLFKLNEYTNKNVHPSKNIPNSDAQTIKNNS